ncbi:IPExxxVDY family protein [Sediminicola luteus]|uniref:IPExxxVDY family protein n=1 Tax=Sediminicola luteus TaxID=319238 RepID=A0A2A4G5P1_9FLAO|nr:IPExxxVDY family protein [Sediminicola luteus]PCE63065.1 hypothetical protein B7P33_17485 [Sediminicola luteus]
MGTVHKLSLDFYEEAWEPFGLLALHCSLEDHSLAYRLNEHADIRLMRTEVDLDMGTACFSCFEYEDQALGRTITLITNKCRKEEKVVGAGLFSEGIRNVTYNLVPEHPRADYLIKMQQEPDESGFLEKIREIPQVVTAYAIDPEGLKSKNNLIF